MSGKGLKMGYNQVQRRLRVEFPALYCYKLEAPPEDWGVKANAKMESLLASGDIDHYKVYTDKLVKVWKAIRENFDKNLVASESVGVNLAQGGRLYNGFYLEPPTDEKSAFNFSITAPAGEIESWNIEWVKLQIGLTMDKMGWAGRANFAQVQAALIRAAEGEKVESLAIALLPPMPEKLDKPYKIVGNKSRKEASILIFDHMLLFKKTGIQAILAAANEAVEKLDKMSDDEFKFRKPELTYGLKETITSVERFGVGLPISLLVATGHKPEVKPEEEATGAISGQGQEAPAAEEVSPSERALESVPDDYPGKGLLPVVISDDEMEVSVGEFDLSIYEKNLEFDETWVINEVKSHGIAAGIKKSLVAKVVQALAQKKDVSGMLIAQTKGPKPGRSPYLYKAFKDLNKGKVSEEKIDIRESQEKLVVHEGDLIAEVRYRTPPELGKNVFGAVIEAEAENKLSITIEVGVEEREPGKYYATVDGMPVVEAGRLGVSSSYIHEGDVNLRTGNVYFDGPAEIRGNIDSGATVMVTGDLIVHGTIMKSFVRSGGNITVKGGGINTTEIGRVQASGDIKAEFIEQSNVIAGGSITVDKVILNSNTISGGTIRAGGNDGGIIAGGSVSSRSHIVTGRLGFPKGAKTEVVTGTDWKLELSCRIKEGRIAKIEAVNQEDRGQLRELTRKSKAQRSPKHEEMLEEIQGRLAKQRRILDALKERVQEIKSNLHYDADAKIFVRGELGSNCSIVCGGSKVAVVNDIMNVFIVAKRRKGQNILAMDQMTEDEQADMKAVA